MLYLLIQICSLLILVPFFDAFLKNVKAFFNWRKWPRIMQSYYDFYKLFNKELVINKHSSFVTILAPIAMLSVFIVSIYFVPVLNIDSPSFNLLYLFYFFALWTFLMILNWMDSSTYFWWLWGERDFFVSFLMEPVMLLLISAFYMIFWNININELSNLVSSYTFTPFSIFVLVILAFSYIIVLLWENNRFPFDNPATHLELTMIHEAMLLETSWPNLAIIELVSKIKLMLYVWIFINLFVPFTFWVIWVLALWLLWAFKVLILLLLLGIYEVYITKLRIFRYQNYTWAFIFLLLLVFIFKIYFI